MSGKLTHAAVFASIVAVALVLWLATRGSTLGERAVRLGPGEQASETTEEQAAGPSDTERSEPQSLDVPPPKPKSEAPKHPKPYRLTEHLGDTSVCELRVSVVDESETPWSGVRVWLSCHRERALKQIRRETEADGVVEVSGLRPGKWQLSVTAGSVQRITNVELVGGRKAEAKIVILRSGALLEGVVRHKVQGPLVGVTVRLHARSDWFSDYLYTKTNEAGSFRLEAIPPGTYQVRVEGKMLGYPARRGAALQVEGAETIQRDLVVDITGLRGVVRDAITRQPIPGVTARLQRPAYRRCSTDAEGVYRFFDIASGKGRLLLTKDGYELLFVDAGDLVAGELRIKDVLLKPAAVLHLHITDHVGRPVAGPLRLSISRQENRSRSMSTGVTADESGHAVYRKISPGMYSLSVWRETARSRSQEIEILPGDNTAHFQIQAVPGKQKKEGPKTLSGTVEDANTGLPISGVRVQVQARRRKEAVSDAQGQWCLRGLQPGKHKIYVSRDGYGFRFIRAVEVKVGEEVFLSIRLTPAATMHVRVADAQGRAVSGRVFMGIRPVQEGKGTRGGTSVMTDGEGRATYRQIVPGLYRLRFIVRERGKRTVEVEIKPGENTLDVTLE